MIQFFQLFPIPLGNKINTATSVYSSDIFNIINVCIFNKHCQIFTKVDYTLNACFSHGATAGYHSELLSFESRGAFFQSNQAVKVYENLQTAQIADAPYALQ